MSSQIGGRAQPHRRTTARVRRRRTFVAIGAVALIAIVAGLSSVGGGKKRGTPKAARTSSTDARPVRLDASLAPVFLPEPRSRAVAVADAGSALIIGGIDTAQATTTSALRFSPPSSLAPAPSLAVPVHDAAAAQTAGGVLVFGGGAQTVGDAVQESSGGKPFSVVGHLPAPRADLAAATIGNTIYLVGGYDGTSASPDVLATTDGTAFRTVAKLVTPVRYPAIATSGSRIYVFGGAVNGVASNVVQSIDVASGRAETVGTLPAARTEADAFTLNGTIYLAGGLVNGAPSADILRFDPSTRTLTPA
ncbi:MAG TPA: hypothetical protein VFR41_03810, partial [Acidimicrobiia bacterium]|nr:hypothetical protein [Acidimicrobiia bacterium]